jgi:hypothetical protein
MADFAITMLPMRPRAARFVVAAACAVGQVCAVAMPVQAATPAEKQQAASEIALAREAAAQQQFKAAYDHAWGAVQLEGDAAGYLLDAATFAAQARLDEQAEKLARDWLALPHRDKGNDLRARQLLTTLGHRRAETLACEAAEASKAGGHAEARRMYLAAAKLAPSEPEHLYGAAIEALAVGDEVAGQRLLVDYLEAKASDVAHRAEAEHLLVQRGATPVSAGVATGGPEPTPTVDHSRRGLWCTVAGSVLAVVGVG